MSWFVLLMSSVVAWKSKGSSLFLQAYRHDLIGSQVKLDGIIFHVQDRLIFLEQIRLPGSLHVKTCLQFDWSALSLAFIQAEDHPVPILGAFDRFDYDMRG
jgi:hypothetical protein